MHKKVSLCRTKMQGINEAENFFELMRTIRENQRKLSLLAEILIVELGRPLGEDDTRGIIRKIKRLRKKLSNI